MSNAYFGERDTDPGITWIFGIHPNDARQGSVLRRGEDGKLFTVISVEDDGVVRCISDDPFITDEMLTEWIA